MNREQAKQILLACRPGSRDRQDPEVAQALELAQRDPSLHLWLERQSAFHLQLRSELRRIPVPPDLKERILAERKIVRPIWRRVEWNLLAACLGLALVLAGLWLAKPPQERTFATFRTRMVGFALRLYQMDIQSDDLGQVRQFLHDKGAPADYTLSAGLLNTPVKGGAKLSWQGNPVAMVCFRLPKNETLYLFVMNETAIAAGELPGDRPVLSTVRGITTASWSRNGQVYLMAAADSAVLQRLLEAKWERPIQSRLIAALIVSAGVAD